MHITRDDFNVMMQKIAEKEKEKDKVAKEKSK
jgi:hypothetical protein